MELYDDLSRSSSSSSSSDEEEVLIGIIRRTVEKNKQYAEGCVPEYSDDQFFSHFRLSRELVSMLSERFARSPHFPVTTNGRQKITAYKHILIFCWFAGHQTSSFRDTGDRFNITISSLSRVLNRVCIFLSEMSNEVIIWPQNEEKYIIERHFRDIGFPGVIGCIDGTHIRIDKPDADPVSYINRKGFYSIQVQAVCDHRNKIIDVFIGYPGSVHDSRVFRLSPLGQNLQNKCGNFHLLGDSAHPCSVNLLTPYRDDGQLTRIKRNFNYQLSKCRVRIEHTFGILKQKMRQLFHVKLKSVENICHFIRACCVLHNLSVSDEFDYIPDDQLPVQAVEIIANNDDENNDSEDEGDMDGREVRDHLATTLFMNRNV